MAKTKAVSPGQTEELSPATSEVTAIEIPAPLQSSTEQLEELTKAVLNDPSLFVLFQPELEALKAKKFDPNTAAHIQRFAEKLEVTTSAFRKISALTDDLNAKRTEVTEWANKVIQALQKPVASNPWDRDRFEVYERLEQLETTGNAALETRIAALEQNSNTPPQTAPSNTTEIKVFRDELETLREGVTKAASTAELEKTRNELNNLKKENSELRDMFNTLRQENADTLAKIQANQTDGDK